MMNPRKALVENIPSPGLRLVLLLAFTAACLLPKPARAQGCIRDGADLEPGLSFLETHARPESSRAVSSVASDPLAGKLILNDSENARTTVQILAIDCEKTAFGTGWQGDNRMWIYCLDDTPCVQDETRSGASDDWAPGGPARNSASFVTESGDAPSTEELSRAFSRVIYLLQQQFGAMHSGDAPPPPPQP